MLTLNMQWYSSPIVILSHFVQILLTRPTLFHRLISIGSLWLVVLKLHRYKYLCLLKFASTSSF